MCSDMYSRRGTFTIPAMVRRGNEVVPEGTLDLTRLLDPSEKRGSTVFHIPDAQWLVDNGWIESDEAKDGPFFIKQLQMYPLPLQDWRKVKRSTKFSLLENKLGKELFLFDESVQAMFSIDDNNRRCMQLQSPVFLR